MPSSNPISNPTIRIVIIGSNNSIDRIYFKPDQGKGLMVQIGLRLDEFISEYYNGLVKFRLKITTKSNGLDIKSYEVASSAIQQLYELGNDLRFMLFKGEFTDKVRLFFQDACKEWQYSGSEGYIPPIVQIVAKPGQVIPPFEFFPLFDNTTPIIIKNDLELSANVTRFLGFSTIITRIFTRRNLQATNQEINNIPSLRIRYFQHAGLVCARDEEKTFNRTGWIGLHNPWPNGSLSSHQFVTELAFQLWNASSRPLTFTSPQLDHVQHFACHCDTERRESRDYVLELTDNSWLRRFFSKSATIRQITREFATYGGRNEDAKPLIFLNACGSSKLTPSGATSFPELFLSSIGNREVIGTEASIPDRFAAQFSKQFYLNLIRGKSLGEAMFEARWNLLKRCKNPLGILYTTYGNPDLRVRKKDPNATLP